ncbi:MAG: dockerin type I repeat-containing protein, partial [Prevotella sp.]|nr:dockerin type I repeat-containing protein [Prevotella sp.]
GDVNGSGHIDVTDVVMEVNYILGEEPESFVFKNADMNGDKTINISDVMEIINIILNQD